jgi:hypothetical protein
MCWFEVLDILFWKLEASRVPYLAICKILQILVIKSLDPDPDLEMNPVRIWNWIPFQIRIRLKFWIRIRIELMRILLYSAERSYCIPPIFLMG